MSKHSPFVALRRAFPALRRLRLFGGRRYVPHVQQTTAADCGAACLAMVLAYHGRDVTLREVREETGADIGGLSAASILRAARWFHLRGRAFQLEDPRELRYLAGGSILHWQFRHFVVLERVTKKGAFIVDPAHGRRLVTWKELDQSFTGIALTLEPGDRFERGGEAPGGMGRYFRKLLESSDLLSRTVVVSILVRLLALSTPILTGLIVDRVVPREDYRLLSVLGIGLAMLVVFTFIAQLLRSHLLLHHRTRMDTSLSLNFLEHLVGLPYVFFQQRTTGDLMLRLNSNTKIRETLTSGTLSAALDGLLASLYLVILFAIHLELALLVLGLALLRVALYMATRRRYRELSAELLQAQASTRDYEVQLLAGIGTLKAMGAERQAVTRWSNLFVNELNVSLAQGRVMALFEALLWSVGNASPFVVLLFGSYQVLDGALSLGTMLAVSALAVGFLSPLSDLLANTAMRLQQLRSYLDRVEDVFEAEPEQDPETRRRELRLRGRVSLGEVSFRYTQSSPLVVRDVSLEIEPGQFVAIVGASGAGKSTLAHLILGLYQPSSGSIRFDGVELMSLDLQAVRRQLGIVPHDPYLFGDTIRRNIALGDPSLPLHRIVQAARTACIHREIEALPMGYDTHLASGGTNLSGGQRQRVALARSLVHRPALMLLDEATSHLDAVTERKIQDNLDDLACTRIVIAHRLSTIRKADHILVMEEGRLVEQGSHEELLSLDGYYARLLGSQRDRPGDLSAGVVGGVVGGRVMV